jgi:hypothetical protein
MADLVISERDAERLREIARRENRPVEEIVSQMIDVYASRRNNGEAQAQPGKERSSYMQKLYAQARQYWQNVNDTERLSLTDAQLDEQFWCIDPEGIPRLKSDQDKITLPPDGLLAMAQAAEREGFSATEPDIDYRKILNEEFPDYLWRRMQDGDDKPTTD